MPSDAARRPLVMIIKPRLVVKEWAAKCRLMLSPRVVWPSEDSKMSGFVGWRGVRCFKAESAS